MNRNLIPLTRAVALGAATAAGFGDTIAFTEIDAQGYDSVVCRVLLGAITATGIATLRVRESDTSGTYGAGTIDLVLNTDGTVASVVATTGDSSKVLSLEVYRPKRRYLKFELVRATANVAIVGVLGEAYGPLNSILTQAVADGYALAVAGSNVSLV